MLNITLKAQTSEKKFTSKDLNELRHSFAQFVAELEDLKGQGLKHEIEVTYK